MPGNLKPIVKSPDYSKSSINYKGNYGDKLVDDGSTMISMGIYSLFYFLILEYHKPKHCRMCLATLLMLFLLYIELR